MNMTLFEEIVSECNLLSEIRQGNDKLIIAAINGMYRVRIVYDDGEPRTTPRGRSGKQERNIFPIVYGKLKNGKPAVAAYEAVGSTKRGLRPFNPTPQGNPWKLFLLDKIVSWSNSSNKFSEDMFADGYGNKLNKAGDKRFNEIFAISPLCDEYTGSVKKETTPIGSKPITRTEITPVEKTTQPSRVQPIEKPQPQGAKSVDNSSEKQYIPNKLEAPDTKPITQGDVDGEKSQQSATVNTQSTPLDATVSDKPVSQDDVETPTVNSNNKLSDAYNDMMKRWANLYNADAEDSEEEKEEI